MPYRAPGDPANDVSRLVSSTVQGDIWRRGIVSEKFLREIRLEEGTDSKEEINFALALAYRRANLRPIRCLAFKCLDVAALELSDRKSLRFIYVNYDLV